MNNDFEILAIMESHADQFSACERALAEKLMAVAASDLDDDENEQSEILQIEQGVGVVTIKGMLTNNNSWLNKYFGLVAYDEIRKASLQAVESGVGGVMYHIGSPGGRVAGMNGAAELISSLPVPTLAFSEEMMASAALFLGIQADHVYAGDFASVGSVGVVSVSADMSEKYKKEGIRPIRYRSGDLKMAGHPAFKPTDKEGKYMQEQVMLLADKFYNIVSEARGIPVPMLDSLDITSGRTFIGEQAHAVGLVDGILTFDDAFLKIAGLAKKNIDSRTKQPVPYGRL